MALSEYVYEMNSSALVRIWTLIIASAFCVFSLKISTYIIIYTSEKNKFEKFQHEKLTMKINAIIMNMLVIYIAKLDKLENIGKTYVINDIAKKTISSYYSSFH